MHYVYFISNNKWNKTNILWKDFKNNNLVDSYAKKHIKFLWNMLDTILKNEIN